MGNARGSGAERFSLHLLGDLRLSRDSSDVRLAPRSQRLISLLAITGTTTRAQLCGTLWPDVGERRAQGALRTILWRMRQASPGVLTTAGPLVGLDGSVACDIADVERIARAVIRGEYACLDLDEVGAMLGGTGELLSGWTEDWVILERERLRQLRLHALDHLSKHLVDVGRLDDALAAARAAVASEPLRESGHRAVLRVLMAAGDLPAARGYLAVTRRRLRGALGVGPSPRLEAIAVELSAADV